MFTDLLTLLAVASCLVDATPLPFTPSTSLTRRMDPAVADKSIFFKSSGPSCIDIRQELQDHGLVAVSKLNPNWIRVRVNDGKALTGPLDEVRIKIWRDDQTDQSKWLEPILVETEQVVKFDDAMQMKSVDGLGWWDVGTTHNGAKSPETGWWPAAYEKAMLQVGFPEMTADGQYAVMGNHRGLQAITGKPVMSYEVDWDSTPDGEKEASLAYYADVLKKADFTPMLLETRAGAKNLASGYCYAVMTANKDGNGDQYVTLFMPWYTEMKEFKLTDIMGDIERVTFLRDFPALMTP